MIIKVLCKKIFKNTGIPRGLLDTDKLGMDVGVTKITKILDYYSYLSAEWLMTGKGDMIKDKTTKNVTEVNSNIFRSIPKLQKKLPFNVQQFLLRTDKKQDHQVIPIYNIEASAGLVKLLDNPTSNTVIDYISIPNLPNCDGALYVTGDSMYPLLKSGDIVAYKNIHDIQNDIFYGEMYILSIDLSGEELVTIKYVQKSEKEGYIKLVSQNKHHSDKDVSITKIRALALIKASIRYNMMY